MIRRLAAILLLAVGFVFHSCRCSSPAEPPKAPPGDALVVCGQYVHVGAKVVLWDEPGGYNAYDVPPGAKKGYGARGGVEPNLPDLLKTVDQFVIHYDVCGTSRRCFEVLQKRRLSAHFLLDLDGTIYQTLDLKERAWHATISNDRSVGIEIANIGAYPKGQANVLDRYYDEEGLLCLDEAALKSLLRPEAALRSARPERISGRVQGIDLEMYDLTEAQYASLIRLTAALCRFFPRLRCDAPRDQAGEILPHVLSPEAWKRHRGLLGHYHVQKNKTDPGPAFQWERVIEGARRLLSAPPAGRE